MKTKTAIKHAGSAANLAALFGISRAAISQWGKEMPELRVFQLQVLKPEWFVSPSEGSK